MRRILLALLRKPQDEPSVGLNPTKCQIGSHERNRLHLSPATQFGQRVFHRIFLRGHPDLAHLAGQHLVVGCTIKDAKFLEEPAQGVPRAVAIGLEQRPCPAHMPGTAQGGGEIGEKWPHGNGPGVFPVIGLVVLVNLAQVPDVFSGHTAAYGLCASLGPVPNDEISRCLSGAEKQRSCKKLYRRFKPSKASHDSVNPQPFFQL